MTMSDERVFRFESKDEAPKPLRHQDGTALVMPPEDADVLTHAADVEEQRRHEDAARSPLDAAACQQAMEQKKRDAWMAPRRTGQTREEKDVRMKEIAARTNRTEARRGRFAKP
jgi:hypothetical protein